MMLILDSNPKRGDTQTVSLRKINAILKAMLDGGGPPPLLPFDVGNTVAGSQVGSFVGITSVQIHLPKTGTLQSLTIFANVAGIQTQMGLYADNAGLPGALLASSAIFNSSTGASKAPISSGPTLPAGAYWVAVLNSSGFNGYYNTGGLGAWNNAEPFDGTLPNPFSSPNSGAFSFSMYATFLG
jgi:hypothetical protein